MHVALAAVLVVVSPSNPAAIALPSVMLWAWESPQPLGFLDPTEAGVAFLALTATIEGERVVLSPRRQPLETREGVALVPVVRVEPGRPGTSAPDDAAIDDVVRATVALAARPGVRAIQLDFESWASQRAFHLALLQALRESLPDDLPLLTTALASWCLGDRWLDSSAADAAVPMLLRMGPDGAAVRARLDGGRDFDCARCRGDLGLSTDEPFVRVPQGRRVWLFHRGPWTAAAWRAARERLAEAAP